MRSYSLHVSVRTNYCTFNYWGYLGPLYYTSLCDGHTQVITSRNRQVQISRRSLVACQHGTKLLADSGLLSSGANNCGGQHVSGKMKTGNIAYCIAPPPFPSPHLIPSSPSSFLFSSSSFPSLPTSVLHFFRRWWRRCLQTWATPAAWATRMAWL